MSSGLYKANDGYRFDTLLDADGNPPVQPGRRLPHVPTVQRPAPR